jgi:hypothetical protein
MGRLDAPAPAPSTLTKTLNAIASVAMALKNLFKFMPIDPGRCRAAPRLNFNSGRSVPLAKRALITDAIDHFELAEIGIVYLRHLNCSESRDSWI